MGGQVIQYDINGDQIINGSDMAEVLSNWSEYGSNFLSNLLANYGTAYGVHTDGTLHIIHRDTNPQWGDSPFNGYTRLTWDSGFYNYNHLSEPRMIRFAIDQEIPEDSYPIQNTLIGLGVVVPVGLITVYLWSRHAKQRTRPIRRS